MARSRRNLLIAGLVLLPAILLVYVFSGESVDLRLSARPGGSLTADVEFGSGLAFDRGSLLIETHEDDDVRVTARISGWGKYAVDVEARERAGDVHVIGRVEGFLHWILTGPTLDIHIFVPEGYGVNARVDGGALLLENLSGPVEARAEEGGRNRITLKGAEGVVKLVAHGSEVRAEDVEGALKVEIVGGEVRIANVTGTTVVSAQAGGTIEIERLRGKLHAATEYGHIHVKDVSGDVDLETDDGRILLSRLDGRVRARSRHGDIDVAFSGDPAGTIETEGGSIEVEVPADARFDLEIDAARGSVELVDGLAFVPNEDPNAVGRRLRRDLGDASQLGLEVATEIHHKVMDRVQRQLERGRRTGRWDGDWGDIWDEDWSWSWDDPNWRWHDHPWRLSEGGWGDTKSQTISGSVNGGGETLVLRSRGGRIRVQD